MGTTFNTTDEQLWAAFQTGDESAWGELVARHRAAVVKYTLDRVGDGGRAEQIVDDVFRRIAGRRDHTPVAFRPWPYTLANKSSEPYWTDTFREGCDIGEFEGLTLADVRALASAE